MANTLYMTKNMQKLLCITVITCFCVLTAPMSAAQQTIATDNSSSWLSFELMIIAFLIATSVGIALWMQKKQKTKLTQKEDTRSNTIAQELEKSENRFRSLIETINDIVWETDTKGCFTYISPQVEAITGFAAEELAKLYFPCLSTHPSMNILSNDAVFFSALIKKQEAFTSLESWQFNKSGKPIVFEISGVPIFNEKKTFQGYRGVARNITRRKHAQEELKLEKERFQVTLESIADGVLRTNTHNLIEYINPAACRLIGVDAASSIGKPLDEFLNVFDETSGMEISDMVKRAIVENRNIHFVSTTLFYQGHANDSLNVEIRITPIRNQKGGNIGAIIVFHDITEIKRLTGQMSHQSTHDTLTELYNRAEFERRLEASILSAKNQQATHVLCYLDLDQFNVINDSFGHIAGDELLKQLAQTLLSAIRETDVLARIGGDEFGILLIDCDTSKATELVNKICKQIRNFRLPWQDKTIQIGVSAGLVLLDHNISDLSDVFSAADSACFVAKELGRNRIHLFHPNDTDLAKRHGLMQWMHHIRDALKENRFTLYCEGFVPLSENAHAIKHYETLVRMTDSSGKDISPMSFIPAAERYHLMPDIDRWVIKNTFQTIATALPQRTDTIYTINISGQSLSDANFLKFVTSQLENHNVCPKNICFEITETAAITHFNHALRLISSLRSLGCSFALDDFGTGLSSFTYLRSLPVQYLKIDGSFVRNIQDDPIDYAMVSTINQIGQLMGLTTIGEYVESQCILEKVKEIGIDYAQGHGVAETSPLHQVVMKNRQTTD